jgi:hypothetical protein
VTRHQPLSIRTALLVLVLLAVIAAYVIVRYAAPVRERPADIEPTRVVVTTTPLTVPTGTADPVPSMTLAPTVPPMLIPENILTTPTSTPVPPSPTHEPTSTPTPPAPTPERTPVPMIQKG